MAEAHHLFDEFRAEISKFHVVEILELLFFDDGSDHGGAVAAWEELGEGLADFVLGVVEVGSLILQCLLEILTGRDYNPVLIKQLESKISNNPHKRRHVLINRVTTTRLDMLSQINHQR